MRDVAEVISGAISGSVPAVRATALGSLTPQRVLRMTALLTAVGISAWLSLSVVESASRVPPLWPAGGLMTGLFLTTPRLLRPYVVALSAGLVLLAHLAAGYELTGAAGFTISTVVAAWVVRARLVHGLGGRHAALLDQGDVSRMIAATTTGSLVAALGCAATSWATGTGTPWLGAVGAFGVNAASCIVVLPLFLETLRHEPLAGTRERLVQSFLTVGTFVLLLSSDNIPLIIFAAMPMFAWHAFRGTLREATVLLALVSVIGSVTTALDVGSVWGLGERYGLAPELVSGVLQLFLIDCGLILLPLSVMMTQQRMAAARADAERATLQRVVHSASGTAIVATGRDGRIEIFNPAAELMFGCSAVDALGQLPDMFHPEEELRSQARSLHALPNFADICRASVAAEDTMRLWQVRRPDGEERTVRMTLSEVRDERGQLTGFLATAEDVTEREAAQAALMTTLQHQQTAVERLEELERVKGDFVSTVSHELRTPITSIIGYTEMMEDGMVGDLDASQLEMVARIDRNGRRLLLLVEDLLTLSQIESSLLKIDPVTVDLRTVVEMAYDALETKVGQRDLHLSVSVPDQPVVHQGDPVQLERMLVNLLTNAVKFTPDGGSIALSLKDTGSSVEMIVEDSGLGISEQEQAQLFTRFFRSTTATEQAIQGTGLGLTIVQAIVALHGGQVQVTSEEGRGTAFCVVLPRTALLAVPHQAAG